MSDTRTARERIRTAEFCRQVRDVERDVTEDHGVGCVRDALYG